MILRRNFPMAGVILAAFDNEAWRQKILAPFRRSILRTALNAPWFTGPFGFVDRQPRAHELSIVFTFNSVSNLPVMTPNPDEIDIHSEAFLHRLMRRQLRLSIACAATFLVALLGLPLLNYFAPALMSKRVAGFTFSWLLLGVLFFPLVWGISFYFIKRSIALEEEEARRVKLGAQPTAVR